MGAWDGWRISERYLIQRHAIARTLEVNNLGNRKHMNAAEVVGKSLEEKQPEK